jgi:lipoate-protein ligase A
MSRDEALLALVGPGREGAPAHVLRTHGWAGPTLSLGRTQSVLPSLAVEAEESGVALVRRPTGGGWLLHLPGDPAVTVVAAGPLGAGELRGTARLAARGIALALAGAGRPGVALAGAVQPASRAEVCFERADRDEVVVGETKVAGVALARIGRSALVQAALPVVAAPPGTLAAFASRWDPRRAAAAEVLRGVDPARLAVEAGRALASILETEAVAWDMSEDEIRPITEALYCRKHSVPPGREGTP